MGRCLLGVEHKEMVMTALPHSLKRKKLNGKYTGGSVSVHDRQIFWEARRRVVVSREVVMLALSLIPPRFI